MGEQHLRIRKILQPAFGPTHLMQVVGAVIEVMDEVSRQWKVKAECHESVDVQDYFRALASDVMYVVNAHISQRFGYTQPWYPTLILEGKSALGIIWAWSIH